MKRLFNIMFYVILMYCCIPINLYAKNIAYIARTGIQSTKSYRFVLELSNYPYYTITQNNNSITINIKDIDLSKLKIENSKIDNIKNIILDKHNSNINILLINRLSVKKAFVLNPMGKIKNYRLVLDLENSVDKIITNTSKNIPIVTKRTDNKFSVKNKTVNNNKVNKKIIVIDAGHGGKDPGTIGVAGTYEKDIALAMAKQLKAVLLKNPGYKVILTRENDTFIKLQDRARVAEKHHASLFISIHLNSSPNKKTHGFSIYTLSEKATDEEAKKIAEKENAADLLGVGSFEGYDKITKNILGDLLQTQVKISSVDIANSVVAQVKREIPCIYNPHREAPFVVLRSATPSVLMEIGFLSNAEEEKKLNQKWYREKMAYSIARAIDASLIKE